MSKQESVKDPYTTAYFAILVEVVLSRCRTNRRINDERKSMDGIHIAVRERVVHTPGTPDESIEKQQHENENRSQRLDTNRDSLRFHSIFPFTLLCFIGKHSSI